MNTDIHFYWESSNTPKSRLDVLKTCVYSAKKYNQEKKIILWSNSLDQESFDKKWNIEIRRYDWDIFNDIPLDISVIEKYYAKNVEGKIELLCNPRDFCDLFRIILLYKFGGSYIDTDDICFKKIPNNINNIICRTYDPHTCFYSKISENDVIDGKYREIRGYDNIKFFIRNDCLLNWEPKSEFMNEILSSEKLNNSNKVLNIGDELSMQSLIFETCIKNLEKINKTYSLYLTLIQLYEGHASVCSFWDRGKFGGEMHDIYKNFPKIKEQQWGKYRCSRKVAENYINKLKNNYEAGCFIWLQDKDSIEEYFYEKPKENMLLSSQIYHIIKDSLKND